MCAEPKTLWIDRQISLQVLPGEPILAHCGEGVIERPPTTKNFAARQHCLPIDKNSLGIKEKEALFDLLGVESWNDIDDGSFNLKAAETFTGIVVSLEKPFDKVSIDALFDDYKMAINAREFMGAGLKRSERWDNVQRSLLKFLRAKCEENHNNIERLEEFGELLDKADAPEDVKFGLKELRFKYADIFGRVELCETAECKNYYEMLAGEKLSGSFRKPALTSSVLFKPPKRKEHILSTTLSLSLGVRDDAVRDETRLSPGVDMTVTAQYPETARITLGANVAYDHYLESATKYGYPSGTFGISGLVISPYAVIGLMPWGEGFSFDAGARYEMFMAERRSVVRQTDYLGNETGRVDNRTPFSTSSVMPVMGYTVLLTEHLSSSTSLTIPTDKNDIMTLTILLGIRHSLL